MDGIKDWLMRVAGILILSAMCEGILPSGNTKKYVRILLGVILIIGVCRPFFNGVSEEFFIETTSYEAFSKTEEMEERERETVLRLYKANLAKKMNDDLKAVAKDCEFEFSIEVEVRNMQEFGRIRGVIITVITDDEELYIDDIIERVISEKYGLSSKNIAVQYMGK